MGIAELLCTDLASVEVALDAGADRLEVCAALEVGGVTPGIGFLKAAVRLAEASQQGAEVVALIRPRRGDFLLDGPGGLRLLLDEVHAAEGAGARGVAEGVLGPDGGVDLHALDRLLDATRSAQLTFHRAIDHAPDYPNAMASLASAGVGRVLTSGGAPSAEEGAEALRSVIEAHGGRVEFIAAGGVRGANAAKVLAATGAAAIHGSCSHPVARGAPQGGHEGGYGLDGASLQVPLGSRTGALPEHVRAEMDPESARAFVEAAHASNRRA